jgi:multiple sugar transport system substrate-binding protein
MPFARDPLNEFPMKSMPKFQTTTLSQVGCEATIACCRLAAFACLLLLLTGCPRDDSTSERGPVKRPLEGVKLRLTVVDDPALAAAIVRVRGEWNTQTGAEFQVDETTEKALLEADHLDADAVLCPSHLLGVLAERELLAPVPAKIVKGSQWAGVFELLKLREAAWAGQAMAVPFGSPLLTCYYRADLLKKLARRPPRTWEEYAELAELLAAEKPAADADWCGAIEPLAPGWAGLTLLARAAPLAKHRDNFSTLFNIETMEPLLAAPGMVQALKDLVAAAKLGPADPFRFDPAAARAAFWNGQCGMALTWPTAADEGGKGKEEGAADAVPAKVDPSIQVGFIELPGSSRVFNLTSRTWDVRADDEDRQVPLLALSGRLGVVSKDSSQLDAAFQLLLWLSDEPMSVQVSAASSATTLFSQSQLKVPSRWVEKPVPAIVAVHYSDTTEAAFRHEQWLGALRLPGRAEYLAALDEAVLAAVRGDKTVQDALLDAEAKWGQITERLGVDKQKAAYRHSLGLE